MLALPMDPEIERLLPLSQAMSSLLGEVAQPHLWPLVDMVAGPLPVEVAAGLWIYVDNLDRAHGLVQACSSLEAAWWHAIIHRREGDFSNAKYWYRQAERHPAAAKLEWRLTDFVDEVESHTPANVDALVTRQRQEWTLLMSVCERFNR